MISIYKLMQWLGLTPEMKIDMLHFKEGDKLLFILKSNVTNEQIEQIHYTLSKFNIADERYLLTKSVKKVIILKSNNGCN